MQNVESRYPAVGQPSRVDRKTLLLQNRSETDHVTHFACLKRRRIWLNVFAFYDSMCSPLAGHFPWYQRGPFPMIPTGEFYDLRPVWPNDAHVSQKKASTAWPVAAEWLVLAVKFTPLCGPFSDKICTGMKSITSNCNSTWTWSRTFLTVKKLSDEWID